MAPTDRGGIPHVQRLNRPVIFAIDQGMRNSKAAQISGDGLLVAGGSAPVFPHGTGADTFDSQAGGADGRELRDASRS
jgi:hypothetical protein